MKTNEHEVVFAIVNAGFAEDVMEVARQQGVRGGTILNARGVLKEEAAARAPSICLDSLGQSSGVGSQGGLQPPEPGVLAPQMPRNGPDSLRELGSIFPREAFRQQCRPPPDPPLPRP